MAEIPQECDFSLGALKILYEKWKFVRKYYITLLIDLANKLYVVEKLLISFYAISY